MAEGSVALNCLAWTADGSTVSFRLGVVEIMTTVVRRLLAHGTLRERTAIIRSAPS